MTEEDLLELLLNIEWAVPAPIGSKDKRAHSCCPECGIRYRPDGRHWKDCRLADAIDAAGGSAKRLDFGRYI